MSKDRLRDAVLMVGIAFAGFLGARALVRISHVQAQTSVTAFTLETELYNDKGELFAREKVAVRSDGTRVVLRTGGPHAKPVWARKISFPDGREVQVHEAIGAKTTFQPSATSRAQVADRLHPPPNCVVPELQLVRMEVLFGQNVAVLRADKGKLRMTDLLSPDLGCERLGYTYEEMTRQGAWQTVTEQKAVSLTLGAPDSKLFEIPAGAVETRPSEVSGKYRALWGQSETPQDKAQDARRDQRCSSQSPPEK
jgi:hypothetical protein